VAAQEAPGGTGGVPGLWRGGWVNDREAQGVRP
jgi:hypothetical protein